jgi:hypothetical protein
MTNEAKKAGKQQPKGAKAPAARVPVPLRDGAGHLNPEHAARLLELSQESRGAEEDERGFVKGHRSNEAIAEELGEVAVSNMTSGEDSLPDALDEDTDQDTGGPFVETSAAEEFADGTDASNIEGATREPFPKTSGG